MHFIRVIITIGKVLAHKSLVPNALVCLYGNGAIILFWTFSFGSACGRLSAVQFPVLSGGVSLITTLAICVLRWLASSRFVEKVLNCCNSY